jgi:predicted GH43/DUF377 family glycosyl hydrolase
MHPARFFSLIMLSCLVSGCSKTPTSTSGDLRFPAELTTFSTYEGNPLFAGTGQDTWDHQIRERGYILREEDGYHLWYTGYNTARGSQMSLGYATSTDGIVWTRYGDRPIFDRTWTEDMMVVKHDGTYYMFAEGEGDIAHMLTSTDKVTWTEHGSLKVFQTTGEPLSPGPYGTPTVYIKDGIWHLFYERNDEGIWLATSSDLEEWHNVQDTPVLKKGPEPYDMYGVALNQVLKHGDFYYAYYHGTPTEDWSEWNMNVAVSEDLITWEKYPGNPIVEENKSSGILVHDGTRYRLYTLHDRVDLHFSSGAD